MFQNATLLSFEDFSVNFLDMGTGLYNKLVVYAGNSMVNETKIFENINSTDIINILERYSDFINAANLDPEKIKAAINDIKINHENITILSAIMKFGFDFKKLFDLYDKVVDVFKPGSNYSVT